MGDLFSAISGSSKKAAKKQARAADLANQVAAEQRDASIANFQPYLDAGKEANSQLYGLLGLGDASAIDPRTGLPNSADPDYGSLLKPFTGADLVNTPGYKFQLQQGNQAIDRKQASSGNYLSGAALKEAQRFAQDYAGTSFQAGYDRNAADKSRVQNFLSSVANLGQNSAAAVGNIRENYTNRFNQNTIGKGNAQAAGIMGQANAIGGAINSGLTLAGLGLGASGAFGTGVQNMLGAGTAARAGAGLNPSSYLLNGSAPSSALNTVTSTLPFFLA